MKHDADMPSLAETMLACLPLGVALYDVHTLCLLQANTAFLSLLDTFLAPSWHSERIIGHSFTEWGDQTQIAHVAAIFRTVAETGTAYQVEGDRFLAAASHKLSWNWTLVPICDADGHTIQLLQTLCEAPSYVPHTAIEDERVRLHAILDQLPEGVLITEVSTGSISYANAAAADLLGISLLHLIGTPLHRSPQATREGTPFDGQHLHPWQFAVIQALCRETVTSQETLVKRPDGSTIVALTSSAPLWMKNGMMTEAVVVFQDITARKNLERQKSEFLWMANHELRTPITIIQGFAEVLQLEGEERRVDASTLYALIQISEQSQQLTRLIEEMLDVSRIEQTRLILHIASHDLLRSLNQVIEGQSITTNKHSIRLTAEGLQANETLVGNFDEARIGRVFHNLISNAIKYSPDGGEIEVGLRFVAERPHEVLIWVKDQGIGIAAHELPHIFKRFYRASSLADSLSGLGIGLYLVKEVMACHGGRVWVESVEGSGSTFYMLLPLPKSKKIRQTGS